MGRGMAANLVRAGFPTRVYDVRFEAVEELAGQGAIPAASAPEAAEGADIVCVSVFDEGQVSSVLLGRDGETGILDTLPEESIVLVHTTVSPEFIVEMDAVARDRGASLIDVAITGGGSAAAVAGELTFVVGGPDKPSNTPGPHWTPWPAPFSMSARSARGWAPKSSVISCLPATSPS